MSVVSLTLSCDWPGCTRTVSVRPGENIDDHGWEYRHDNRWHACPGHAGYSTPEFVEATGEAGTRPEPPEV